MDDPIESMLRFVSSEMLDQLSLLLLQCVRSVGSWSIGTKTIENSIQNAYIQMIDAAQHFIYLEVRLVGSRRLVAEGEI